MKINYKGKQYEIDLHGQIPKELLEKDYKGNLYVNIALVREIARKLKRKLTEIRTDITPLNDNTDKDILVKATAQVVMDIDGTLYPGTADDIYKLDSLSRSCFPNMARVQALAVKNALKRVCPFFEADYLEAEQLGERGLISQNDVKEFNKDKFDELIKEIESCKTTTELAPLANKIADANKKESISPEQFRDLKKIFSDKNTQLK